jgi:murein hydrolase activator
MRRALLLLLLGTGAVLARPAIPQKVRHVIAPPARRREPQRVETTTPTPRPTFAVETPEAPIDLSHALPGKALAHLPSSAQQLKNLSSELKTGTPALAGARQKSESLAAQAAGLRKKLVETANRIETLERQKIDDDEQLAKLEAEDARLSAGFANDRVAVTRLLAVLERLQHDMPPALAMRPDDALAAARGSMLIGASLPTVYAQAAAVARRIDALKRTRSLLEAQRKEASDTADHLTQAHADLDGLLTQKEQEADSAAQDYGALKVRLDQIAHQAADFQALLTRVKALRQEGTPAESVVTVTAGNAGSLGGLARNSLLEPVVGTVVAGGDSSQPGLSYATRPGAQVITPADGRVLFAGPYHKSGQVLILEITTGYDVVLAGLGRVTVKPNDQLLAGEPVGVMSADSRLYFEVRHGGHGQNPAPWLRINLRPAFGKTNKT